MEKQSINNVRLGMFIVFGTLLFILAMYLIGDKQNMFGANIIVRAEFNNVNGLQRGNNVRLAGIDIGTVDRVRILSDSIVMVDMVVREDVQRFIKEDAIAIIGTDGLMGNKIVNIGSGTPAAPPVKDGAVLSSYNVLHTDEIFRTLAETNVNVAIVADNLADAIQDVNAGRGVLGRLIRDSVMAKDLQSSIANVKIISERLMHISTSVDRALAQLELENKARGSLLTDSTFANDLRQAVEGLKAASGHAERLTADLHTLTTQINRGEGTAGRILRDTAISNSLERSLREIEQGAHGFNENMEALKHNILFRRFFKKREKERKNTP